MRFAAKKLTDFDPVRAGMHPAVCTGVVDFGVQRGSGKFKPRHDVYLQFELPTERFTYTKGGETIESTRTIGRRFNATMSAKANLRKFVEGWSGHFVSDAAAGNFDLRQLLGRSGLMNVTHNDTGDRVFGNVEGVYPLPKEMADKVYKPEHAPVFYSIDESGPDELAALPDWMRKIIGERIREEREKPSVNAAATGRPASVSAPKADEFDDDIPF